MKKKVILFGSVIILLIIIIVLILCLNKIEYSIRVSSVDDYSPDRILAVYNSKNEKIEVKRIEYLDGTLLCNGYNTTVHFGDIENEKKLKIILKDNTEKTAKIIEEEVKK